MHDPIDELAIHALAQYGVIVQALVDAVQYRGRRAASTGHPRGPALAPGGDGRYLLRRADGRR